MSKSNHEKLFNAAKYVIGFCNENKISITHLKLQKMLYYVQGWALAIFNKEIFPEDFRARINGPVCKEVYQKYSSNGFNELKKEDYNNKLFSAQEIGLMSEVIQKYGKFNAWELVAFTHEEQPRKDARKGLLNLDYCDNIIPKEAIKKSFKLKLK